MQKTPPRLSATFENKAIVKIRSTRSDRSDRDGSLSKKLISVGLPSTRSGQTYTKYVWGESAKSHQDKEIQNMHGFQNRISDKQTVLRLKLFF